MNSNAAQKIFAEFVYQLAPDCRVHLYRTSGERDGLPFVLVLCEGSKWMDAAGKAEGKPLQLTPREALNIIKDSFFPSSCFYVEPAF